MEVNVPKTFGTHEGSTWKSEKRVINGLYFNIIYSLSKINIGYKR